MRKYILVIDDDSIFRERLAVALSDRQYQVVTCPDADSGLNALQNSVFDGIICDLKMPKLSGLDFLKCAQEVLVESNTPVVILTGHGSIASAVAAMKLGCVNYLKKPASIESILAALFQTPPEKLTDSNELSLKEIEREHIEYVLFKNDGNITRAARELGIHRRSLQRKLS